MSKPLLSIGMIIKNEMRCLERCLKSLEPLRAQIPCQLVIADTGSTDGSRALAERYADILVDYPWNQDFAAARNAVLEPMHRNLVSHSGRRRMAGCGYFPAGDLPAQ